MTELQNLAKYSVSIEYRRLDSNRLASSEYCQASPGRSATLHTTYYMIVVFPVEMGQALSQILLG